MKDVYDIFFKEDISILTKALQSVDSKRFSFLIKDCKGTIEKKNKIIASGIGKNVPICEKFVGTLLSMGIQASFLDTNNAVHGDMGMIKQGDLVIVLSKSGETSETIYLYNLLKKRKNVTIWIICFNRNSILIHNKKAILIDLEHEGDKWNIVPNHSSTLNLLLLQKLAIEISKELKLDLNKDFKPNHPGGAIGKYLCKRK